MKRFHVVSLLFLLIAAPFAGRAFFSPREDAGACFSTGDASYRLSSQPASDFRVRIDNAAARPDLRLQLVDNPELADFVLVDGFGGEDDIGCKDGRTVKSFRVDNATPAPDLTIGLSRAPSAADYKIYVRSTSFSQQDAAALFAVMTQPARKHALAARR